MTTPRCEDCKYWERCDNPGARGECRYNPPIYHDPMTARWPVTNLSDWCREFTKRDP